MARRLEYTEQKESAGALDRQEHCLLQDPRMSGLRERAGPLSVQRMQPRPRERGWLGITEKCSGQSI